MRPISALVLFVLALAVGAAGLHAAPLRAQQPPAIAVTLDRDTVTVGDRIVVTVVLRLPENNQPDLTAIETQFGELDVLVIGIPELRPLSDGVTEYRVRYEVAAFRTGDLQIPDITVPYRRADGSVDGLVSTPLPVRVQSVLPDPMGDTPEVRDLKPQLDLPYRAPVSRAAIIGVAAFVVAGVMAAAGLIWWRIRRELAARPAAVPVVVDRSPEERARAELERIARDLLDRGAMAQVHVELAACVRRYLSDRYGFPAFALTSGELRVRMEQHGVGRWQARLVAGLLSECDAVQYARYAPARGRAENNLSMAFEIVELTSERAETPPPPQPVQV